MKKILGILIFFLSFLIFASPVRADDLCDISTPQIVSGQKASITIINKTSEEQKYLISINPPGGVLGSGIQRGCLTVPPGGSNTYISESGITELGNTSIAAYHYKSSAFGECVATENGQGALLCSSTLKVTQGNLSTEKCTATATNVHPGEKTTVNIKNNSQNILDLKAVVSGPGTVLGAFGSWEYFKKLNPGETWIFQHQPNAPGGGPFKGKVDIFEPSSLGHGHKICTASFVIATNLEDALKTLQGFQPEECYGNGYADDTGYHPGAKGIQTALGCIPTEIQPFVSWLFKYAISIAGGIAFLMIIFASFQMITSSGDPEKLNKAKQMLGSAVAGLLFIAFAVFLLRVIGVDILKIF